MIVVPCRSHLNHAGTMLGQFKCSGRGLACLVVRHLNPVRGQQASSFRPGSSLPAKIP
jgi:hypothetical protein